MFRKKLIVCLLCLALVIPCASALAASVESYPLWIGGVQVTAANCSDLENNHWSYQPATHTLTLDGYTYSGQGYQYKSGHYAVIYYNGSDALTVSLSGKNVLTLGMNFSYDDDQVLRSDNAAGSAITFTGSGSLDATVMDSWGGPAIYSTGPIIFSSGSFLTQHTEEILAAGNTCITAMDGQSVYVELAGAENHMVICGAGG